MHFSVHSVFPQLLIKASFSKWPPAVDHKQRANREAGGARVATVCRDIKKKRRRMQKKECVQGKVISAYSCSLSFTARKVKLGIFGNKWQFMLVVVVYINYLGNFNPYAVMNHFLELSVVVVY